MLLLLQYIVIKLTYILSTAKLNAIDHCWLGELAGFHFVIKYRPGKMNADADMLSPYPTNLQEHIGEYTETVPIEIVAAIWHGDKLEERRSRVAPPYMQNTRCA